MMKLAWPGYSYVFLFFYFWILSKLKICLWRLLTLVVKVTTKSWLCVRDVKMYNIHTGEVKSTTLETWENIALIWESWTRSLQEVDTRSFFFFLICEQTAVWVRQSVLVDIKVWDTHHLFFKALRIRRMRNLWFAPTRFCSRSGPKILFLKQGNTIHRWMVERDLMTSRLWMFLLNIQWHYIQQCSHPDDMQRKHCEAVKKKKRSTNSSMPEKSEAIGDVFFYFKFSFCRTQRNHLESIIRIQHN